MHFRRASDKPRQQLCYYCYIWCAACCLLHCVVGGLMWLWEAALLHVCVVCVCVHLLYNNFSQFVLFFNYFVPSTATNMVVLCWLCVCMFVCVAGASPLSRSQKSLRPAKLVCATETKHRSASMSVCGNELVVCVFPICCFNDATHKSIALTWLAWQLSLPLPLHFSFT